MIWWTGLAPWEFQFPFLGSLTSTFLAQFVNLRIVGLAEDEEDAFADENERSPNRGCSFSHFPRQDIHRRMCRPKEMARFIFDLIPFGDLCRGELPYLHFFAAPHFYQVWVQSGSQDSVLRVYGVRVEGSFPPDTHFHRMAEHEFGGGRGIGI